jgi:anti-sigma factor RsiW
VTEPHRPVPLTHDEVLELGGVFVLDALDPDELAAVRAHLASCPLDHSELATLASAVPVLAETISPVEPPAGLKGRIMAAAEADLAARGSNEPVEIAPPPPVPYPTGAEWTTRAERRGASAGTWLLRIAAVLAIVVLAGWNLLLQNQLNAAKTFEDQVASVVETASQPGAVTAVLRAEGGGPSGLAAVSADGAMRLAMRELPATTGSQVYEAWAIGADSVPVALGGFQVGQGGTGYLTGGGVPATPGITLAVTLEPVEPAVGSSSPTLPIVSSGATTAAG